MNWTKNYDRNGRKMLVPTPTADDLALDDLGELDEPTDFDLRPYASHRAIEDDRQRRDMYRRTGPIEPPFYGGLECV